MPGSTKTVLIVDDEPHIVLALETLLSGRGFRILTAGNGDEGLARAREVCPDLVLLDVMMPGQDGWSVARAIRTWHGCEHTQIVFLTAKGTTADRHAGYDAGAEYYITKPFDNRALLDLVDEALDTGR